MNETEIALIGLALILTAWGILRCQNAKEERALQREWPTEERIDAIGPNGNEGEHYAILESQLNGSKCNAESDK
jgi:hypothetical protein